MNRYLALTFALLLVACGGGGPVAAATSPTDGYSQCSFEGSTCAVKAGGIVIFGVDTRFTAPKRYTADVLCSVSVLGDPAVGAEKSCWLRADPVNPCTGLAITGPVWYYSDVTASSTLACLPIPSTTSTKPYLYVNDKGAAAYYFCKAGGKWYRQMGAATWGFLSGHNIATDARDALAAPDALTVFLAKVKASVNLPLADPSLTPVWCPATQEMWDNKPADDAPPPPPPPVATWIVTPSGTAATRPAYPVVNGKRSSSPGSSAKVREPCDCAALKLVEFGIVNYCLVPPSSLVPTTTMPHVAGCVLK